MIVNVIEIFKLPPEDIIGTIKEELKEIILPPINEVVPTIDKMNEV